MLIQPLVSVIMPVYNTDKFIANALDSILKQTYSNLQILISDDGSSDKSKEIINSYIDKRIQFIHNDRNIGYLKTCNKLFEFVKGEFIAFQDSDDWSYPTRIEKIMDVLLNDNEIALCGCNFIRIDKANNKVITISDYPTTDYFIKEYIDVHKELPFCGASVILRKNVYNEIGGYKLFYDRLGYEDSDWFLRINERFKTANISLPLYVYNYFPNSVSRSEILNNYKKFYIKDIAWFLKNQRMKYGEDALENNNYLNEFQDYLEYLRKSFMKNRYFVYKKVIYNHLSNQNTSFASEILKEGILKKELKFLQFCYLKYRIFRTKIKIILKRK